MICGTGIGISIAANKVQETMLFLQRNFFSRNGT
ncbi:RpiB/LacA/LacB family sugar-phosphate isomerase [Sporolactobacillus terrae]|nr:RpiB/LacA/LacB family sugar-phosphate isomerase [Sporolactobacillus terrae]